MDVAPIFWVVLGILVVVVVVAIVMRVVNSGKSTFASANDELTNAMGQMSSSVYDVYDGTSFSGSSVIDAINNSWEDTNVQVVVSTANPVDRTQAVNLIYDKTLCVETGGEIYAGELTNLPAADYATETTWDSIDVAHSSGDDATCYEAGYYVNPDQGIPGYISDSSTFKGSVQKDVNGVVRRITFIQR